MRGYHALGRMDYIIKQMCDEKELNPPEYHDGVFLLKPGNPEEPEFLIRPGIVADPGVKSFESIARNIECYKDERPTDLNSITDISRATLVGKDYKQIFEYIQKLAKQNPGLMGCLKDNEHSNYFGAHLRMKILDIWCELMAGTPLWMVVKKIDGINYKKTRDSNGRDEKLRAERNERSKELYKFLHMVTDFDKYSGDIYEFLKDCCNKSKIEKEKPNFPYSPKLRKSMLGKDGHVDRKLLACTLNDKQLKPSIQKAQQELLQVAKRPICGGEIVKTYSLEKKSL